MRFQTFKLRFDDFKYKIYKKWDFFMIIRRFLNVQAPCGAYGVAVRGLRGISPAGGRSA